MEIIVGKTIHDAVIRIDKKSFVNCDLARCTLEYAGDEVSFQMTRLRQCRYIFFGPAKRTVLFLQETGLMAFDERDWGESGEEASGEKRDRELSDGKTHGRSGEGNGYTGGHS